MEQYFVLRVISKLLLPYILLFALYVQFHGDYGPGGGFQAGVIFAAGIILYTLVFGLPRAVRTFPPRQLELLMACGVLIYGGVGVYDMLHAGNFLDYNVMSHDPEHGQHLGILLVELGVGVAVATTMISIFYVFAERRNS